MRINKERLHFFDITKVIAILLIVIHHIPDPFIYKYNIQSSVLPVIGNITLGSIGLIIFLFTSGALLYYNYPKIDELGKYFFRRLSRIYPAYWISIFFGMVLFAALWKYQTPLKLLTQFSGLLIYIDYNWGRFFNYMGWYIGLIVTFYIVFPLLVKLFERLAPITIIIVVSASLFYRTISYNLDTSIMALNWYYSPISNIGFFVLGMAAIKYGFYPKVNKIQYIDFLADLSFYVFLVHCLLINYWRLNPIIYILAILILSLALMWIDHKLQTIICKQKIPGFILFKQKIIPP